MAQPLIVLDTNVVAAAAMGYPGSNNSLIISEISAGGVRPAISDDYMDELVQTMSKPYIEEHASVGRAFNIALVLAHMGKSYQPRKYDWPSVTDEKDWWILDLAFESGAEHIVTWNMNHLAPARGLGFDVLTPPELLTQLRT